MRKYFLILMACCLLLLASAAPAGASAERPLKGCVSGQVLFTPDEASPSPADLWTDSAAIGRVTHMGCTTMTSRHPTPVTDVIADGELTLVAASGAKLYATYGGIAPFPVIGVPSTIVADTHFTITGGTGRFANATGGGDLTGYVAFPGELDLGPWPAYWTVQATIRY